MDYDAIRRDLGVVFSDIVAARNATDAALEKLSAFKLKLQEAQNRELEAKLRKATETQ